MIRNVDAMSLFTEYCEVYGRKIERGNDIVRFGKHVDSEEHQTIRLLVVKEVKHDGNGSSM